MINHGAKHFLKERWESRELARDGKPAIPGAMFFAPTLVWTPGLVRQIFIKGADSEE